MMTIERGDRPTSPVHLHVDEATPVHVHVKKKQGEVDLIIITLYLIKDTHTITNFTNSLYFKELAH